MRTETVLGADGLPAIEWRYSDGGRADAGYSGTTGDCAARALAIAGEMPYQEAYELINKTAERERPGAAKRRKGRSSAREGVYIPTMRWLMADLGWDWTPTMGIGTGCQVHLRSDELPPGRLLVSVSRHYCAVIDGVLVDNHDCSRFGTRCVYGYWTG